MRNLISKFLILIMLTSTSLFADDKPLSLDDLGFKKTETQSNPELQAQLDKRSSMLKTHQTLALIAAVPMTAQLFLGDEAGHEAGIRNIHMAVGITTAALYWTSAAFAINAPKPDFVVDKGNTKIHRALAWVHAPLMIITPILGALAYRQANQGEVHGIAEFHGTAATALVISYAASLAVMSFNF